MAAYPIAVGAPGAALHQELFSIAYRNAPDEILAALLAMIDKENCNHDWIFVHHKADTCFDERLGAALVAKAKDPAMKPSCMGSLLEAPLRHGLADAVAFAEATASLPIPDDKVARERAKIAAVTLLLHAPTRGWATLWSVFQENPEFGREVISVVAGHHEQEHAASLAMPMTEKENADVYLWLVRQFPPADDPKLQGVHTVGPRESIGYFRDAVLQRLEYRGTLAACQEMDRLVHALPELPWLGWAAREARAVMLRQTWVPPRPAELLRMARDSEMRLVESAEQLLDVLIQSMQRLEQELQGETPSAPYLWNKDADDHYRPKDEGELSNYVTLHLRRDVTTRGIVVNREVEIRRGEGDRKGERTDIHVDAVTPGSRPGESDCISVIIEVKGCWNKGVKTDMKGQLRDRYLKDNRCQFGLYLVGWFNCAQRDTGD